VPEVSCWVRHRSGLPEVQFSESGFGDVEKWCALLTGVAFRLLDEFHEARNHTWNAAVIAGEPTPTTVPSEIQIRDEIGLAADDVADAYCLPGSFESRRSDRRWFASPETPIRLSLDGQSLVAEPPAQWLPSEDKRRRFVPGVLPDWVALDEAQPYIERYQLFSDGFARARFIEDLADSDLITR
jgi:hypothetical protein